MKYILTLVIIALAIFTASGQAQIPNGDFELWTGNNADGWNLLDITVAQSATKTTDSHGGTYAAKLESQNVFGSNIPGIITLGTIDMENQRVTGGIEFADRPTGITAYLKYSPSGADSMYMFAILTKWNTTTEETDTIGVSGYFTSDEFTDYTKISMPFLYNSFDTPDTLNVLFISSGGEVHPGSTMYVDDVTMEYGLITSPTIAFPASDTTATSFKAAWMPLPNPNVTGYRIDVAYDADFTNFLTGYENKQILTPTLEGDYFIEEVTTNESNIFYYRIRVEYGAETTINSNKTIVPMPTISQEATNVSETEFTASWEASNNAVSYQLDIATDENFQNYVAGYESVNVGNVTTINISSLNPETEYFYRIKTVYENDNISQPSNAISLTTLELLAVNNLDNKKVKIQVISNQIFVYTENKAVAEIFDIKGSLIKTSSINKGENVININRTGLFFIKIISENKVYTEKILIK